MEVDKESLPTFTEFGYVEVWDYDSDKDDFVQRFRDDFNYFDDTKWVKAKDKTWGGLSSTFYAEQSYIEDHML